MANTYILGGSPLGLVGLRSRPNQDNMSNFTGDNSRNVNVNSYNRGVPQQTNIKQEDGSFLHSNVSLFTGGALPHFWNNIKPMGSNFNPNEEYKNINRRALHNDEIYDMSLLNIIEKLSFSNKATLRAQDFAYLKNVGVFPNNRLMIARRFSEPQQDNIFGKDGNPPLAVLISWKPENEDFIEFSYGEEWTDAEADFTNILNKLGENFRIGGSGTGLSKMINAVPLPGMTELLQRKLMEELGFITADSNFDIVSSKPLPSGNPNIIKQAKRRKTIGYGEAGSGLKAKISIKMEVEYEQKFISGIDPTVAWMDILQNALSFGTSNSSNYGVAPGLENKIKVWTSKGGIRALLSDIIQGLKNVFTKLKGEISNFIADFLDSSSMNKASDLEKENKEKESTESTQDRIKRMANAALEKGKNLGESILESAEKAIEKYKIELLGVTHALSGLPSTPWHITIGNPLRPIFCSGDMLVEDVTIKMGPTLAFNDLPSNIKIEFTLTNARPYGLQELLSKFNTGYLRTVNTRKDFIEDSTIGSGTYWENIEPTPTPAEKRKVVPNPDWIIHEPEPVVRDNTRVENNL